MYIRELNKVIYLPIDTIDGERQVRAQLNWIRELEHPFYLAGLTFCDHYPYDLGSTEWALESDPIEGFKPMKCTLYHDA